MTLDKPRPQVVILGTGGHGRVIADIILRAGQYSLYGFLDDVNPDRHGSILYDVPILGGREQFARLLEAGITHFVCGIGNNEARLRLATEAQDQGFVLTTAIHPAATLGMDVTIGGGTAVMAGAVVNPSVRIGSNVIINTASSVDHDCRLTDGVHIGPGAHLAGYVSVDQCAWIGIGAIIRDRINIGAGSVIGAGAVVVSDIPPGVIAYGVPARVIRKTGASIG